MWDNSVGNKMALTFLLQIIMIFRDSVNRLREEMNKKLLSVPILFLFKLKEDPLSTDSSYLRNPLTQNGKSRSIFASYLQQVLTFRNWVPSLSLSLSSLVYRLREETEKKTQQNYFVTIAVIN